MNKRCLGKVKAGDILHHRNNAGEVKRYPVIRILNRSIHFENFVCVREDVEFIFNIFAYDNIIKVEKLK